MNISIRWKDIDKSDAVINHLEEKIAKLKDFTFIGDSLKVEFVHYHKENIFKTRMILSVPHSNTLTCESSAKDILTSINDCVHKMTDQLRREKTKRSL